MTKRQPKKQKEAEKLMFSEMLKKILDERSLGQNKAAMLAGVANSVINDWLAGTSPKDLLAVRRLAKALGVSVSYLLYGEREDPLHVSMEEILKTEDKPVMSGLYHIEIKKVNVVESLLSNKN